MPHAPFPAHSHASFPVTKLPLPTLPFPCSLPTFPRFLTRINTQKRQELKHTFERLNESLNNFMSVHNDETIVPPTHQRGGEIVSKRKERERLFPIEKKGRDCFQKMERKRMTPLAFSSDVTSNCCSAPHETLAHTWFQRMEEIPSQLLLPGPQIRLPP